MKDAITRFWDEWLDRTRGQLYSCIRGEFVYIQLPDDSFIKVAAWRIPAQEFDAAWDKDPNTAIDEARAFIALNSASPLSEGD